MKPVALVLLLTLPTLAQAVSFDCRKAATFVEKAICDDYLLSKLDDALDDNYRTMLAANIGSGARKDLKATQRVWLVQRNRCTDKTCLVETYRQRIDEICDYPVSSGVHPYCIASYEVQ